MNWEVVNRVYFRFWDRLRHPRWWKIQSKTQTLVAEPVAVQVELTVANPVEAFIFSEINR